MNIILIIVGLIGIIALISYFIEDIVDSKIMLFYKMELDNNFIIKLVEELEKKGIEFCIEHGIPIYYHVKSPENCTYAGQIVYYYNKIKDTFQDYEIRVNYKSLDIAHAGTELTLEKRITKTSIVSVIFHEIGHYLELEEKGTTTEEGADLYGSRLMASYCDDVKFQFLNTATSIFRTKDSEKLEAKEFIKNKMLFKGIKKLYKEYKEVL